MVYCDGKLIENLKSEHSFYGFTGVITMWDVPVGRTREKLVNQKPKASDLQAFRVLSHR